MQNGENAADGRSPENSLLLMDNLVLTPSFLSIFASAHPSHQIDNTRVIKASITIDLAKRTTTHHQQTPPTPFTPPATIIVEKNHDTRPHNFIYLVSVNFGHIAPLLTFLSSPSPASRMKDRNIKEDTYNLIQKARKKE